MEAARTLSLVRDDTPAQPIETFTAPTVLFRCKQPAVAWLYAWLYDQTLAAGRETCDTSVAAIMEVFERDRRTVEGWLAALAGEPWNAVRVETDALTGQMRVTVYALRPFAPRRPAKCEPQRPLLPTEELRSQQTSEGSVSPVEETRGAVIAPTSDADRAAPEAFRAPREVPVSSAGGFCAKSPAKSPEATGEFAQNPPQNPPSDAAALQRLIEAKRQQALAANAAAPGDFAQNPPQNPPRARAPETETKTRNFEGSARSFKTSKRASPKVSSFSAPETAVPGALGETAEQLAGQWTDPDRQSELRAEVERMIAELVRYGGKTPDGRPLRRAPARKIALAVAAGWIDWQDDVLRLLDSGAALAMAEPPKTEAPWCYLVGTMRKIFAERERCWSSSKPKPKPR